MQQAALVRPTDEWQVREWCRTGLRSLLTAIGTDAFDAALLSYLYLIVRVDRIATVWTTAEAGPRIDSFGGDRDYSKLVADQLDRVQPMSTVVVLGLDGAAACTCAADDGASLCDPCAAVSHLRAVGLAEEIRVVIELGAGHMFAAFLGRDETSTPWGPDELELAKRSLSLIQSVIIAHDRCLVCPQPPHGVQISAERRLVRAFEQRGLSLRESEIVSKVLFGYSTLAIAMDLGISENTVKVHRKHLNQKLGVRSQAELFGFAYKALMDGERL